MKNYISIDEINNEYMSNSHIAAEKADLAFEKQLRAIAEAIRPAVKKCPIILIAGPSGSGKTTTAKMLEAILDSTGMETHTIALDNYFHTIPKEDYVHIESGKIDLESPERLDAELLSDHMNKLAACEPVELPIYDFTNTTRRSSGIILQRKPEEPVIFEGIHALNPDVITIPKERRCGIYVSMQTHISSGDTVLHPLYLRLLRRMIRDRKHRGRSIIQTLAMLREVERGKNRFIKPFRPYADLEIDTFFSYEPGLYRKMLLPELEAELESSSLTPDNRDVLSLVCSILRNADPIEPQLIAEDALIQEFIGDV